MGRETMSQACNEVGEVLDIEEAAKLHLWYESHWCR